MIERMADNITFHGALPWSVWKLEGDREAVRERKRRCFADQYQMNGNYDSGLTV
jgi:hypothetical protein